MGIRFTCPNGHKLHVKTFLAGKRGICPACQSKVQIPTYPEQSAVTSSPFARHQAEGNPIQLEPSDDTAVAVAPREHNSATKVQPPSPLWYVRPSAGGEFGPAKEVTLRQWVNEGRIANDTLLWCEGWTQWREAGTAFPELKTAETITQTASPISAQFQDIIASSPSLAQARRKSNNRKAVRLIIGLLITCLALAGVLLFVIASDH